MKRTLTFTSGPHENLFQPISEGHWTADSASVFLPAGFEKNYAYPLIICLDKGTSPSGSQQFHQRMDSISDRNYIGVRLHVNNTAGQPLESILQQIETAVMQVSRYANIHTERIYILGLHDMADLALQLTLAAPYRFAGFLAIEPQSLEIQGALTHFRKLQHLRGLILTSISPNQTLIRQNARLLHNAGLEISYQFLQADSRFTSFQLINRFIMQNILSNQFCPR